MEDKQNRVEWKRVGRKSETVLCGLFKKNTRVLKSSATPPGWPAGRPLLMEESLGLEIIPKAWKRFLDAYEALITKREKSFARLVEIDRAPGSRKLARERLAVQKQMWAAGSDFNRKYPGVLETLLTFPRPAPGVPVRPYFNATIFAGTKSRDYLWRFVNLAARDCNANPAPDTGPKGSQLPENEQALIASSPRRGATALANEIERERSGNKMARANEALIKQVRRARSGILTRRP